MFTEHGKTVLGTTENKTRKWPERDLNQKHTHRNKIKITRKFRKFDEETTHVH